MNSGEPSTGYWTACDARIAAETRDDREAAAGLNAANLDVNATPLGSWPHAQRRRRG